MASLYNSQNNAYGQITATFGGVAIQQGGLPSDISLRLENQRLRQERDEWKHLATTDTVTGTPNRLALIQHLDDALSFEKSLGAPYDLKSSNDKRKAPTRDPIGVAIGFIDLDGFKAINDTYGHEAGDRVLKEVGNFLSDTLRNTDAFGIYPLKDETPEMAGRLGGDEFVMVLRHTDANHIDARKKDIEATLNMLYIDYTMPNGRDVRIPIKGSLGLIDCDLEKSAESNLQVADAAMYDQKHARKQALESASSTKRFAQILEVGGLSPQP